ncbi:hypothetical protein FB45DRAFT_770694 [Roridomyces roridus]|uniref:Uncharacterized protein n=1 Tax=Roridomyces roridus TaxID=1738132 RepID=A0AAD7F7U5_9AGAR|nr:hypothetical protein FB45DRAFT_770694 [Roridomyces roridus]
MSHPSSSKSGPPNHPTAFTPGFLELRIFSSSVGTYGPPPATISDHASALQSLALGPVLAASNSICLLRGSLPDFTWFSRAEGSHWLLDMGHDICDPQFKRGSLLVFDPTQGQWNPVAAADPLVDSIYFYVLPANVIVGLSKISERNNRSQTGKTGNGTTMRAQVLARDVCCWISHSREPVRNSHICPKRMGDHMARIVYNTFTSTAPPPGLSIYSPCFGICLNTTVDPWFDNYLLGFRYVSPNMYECHDFHQDAATVAYTATGVYDLADLQRQANAGNIVHGSPAAPFKTNNPGDNIPPAGLFRWHYLQCVIKRLAHTDYTTLANIQLHELPYRVEGDDDSDGDCSGDEGPSNGAFWPTAALDYGREEAALQQSDVETRGLIKEWIKTVPIVG